MFLPRVAPASALVVSLFAAGCGTTANDEIVPSEEANTAMFSESQAYERFMGRWSRQLAPLLVEFAAARPGGAVLDVGSGTGALSRAVLTSLEPAEVVGIDPSAAYVAFANEQFDDPRARFEVGDAQELGFDAASFDAALSLLVVNFIPDPERALREMARVTRPGGVVAAAVWDYDDGMQMLRTFWDAALAENPEAAQRDERRMRFARSGELGTLWRSTGLVDVTEEPLVITTRFASFEDYWSPFLEGQGPAGAYLASLSPASRAALEHRLRQQLLPDDTGAIVLQARAWAVRGRVPQR